MVCGVAEGGVSIVIENHLRDAVAVTHVYKGHTSHLAGSLNPSGKSHLGAGIAQAEFSACLSPIHI